ncbi:MAG: LptA/OstA family protein [bacterium]|jgi:lipopolysaccharide transport protein LptA
MRKVCINAAVGCVALLVAVIASAQDLASGGVGGMTMGSGASETHISAKRADYDISRNVLVLDGDVVVSDPRVTIKADQITMLMSTNREPEMVTAVGSVDIEQDLSPKGVSEKKGMQIKGFRKATCGRAVYSVRSGITVLTDKPVITQEGMTLRGSRIIYSRDEDKVHIDNSQGTFVPGEGKSDLGDLMKSKNAAKPQK